MLMGDTDWPADALQAMRGGAACECALHGYQAAIYKMCLGVPSSTSSLLAFFETGRYPLQVQWLARAVRY